MTIKLLATYHRPSMENLENPHNKPIEELKIKYLAHEGQSYEEFIPALDERWCNKDYIFTLYVPPPFRNSDGEFTMGSKEDWSERMGFFVEDLRVILGLPFHRFWSEVVYNNQLLTGVNSFLQLAPPFYLRDEISRDKDLLKVLKKVQEFVFLILIRLTTDKETEKAWMKKSTLGSILYDNFIISLPQLMEVCLIYANDNFKELSDLVNKIMEIQPKYMNDIKKSASFIKQVFCSLENQLMLTMDINGEPSVLHDARGSLSPVEVMKTTLLMLDISYSTATFLKVYIPAASIFHAQNLEPRIASFYGNTVPVLSRYLDEHYKKEGNQDQYESYQLKMNLSRHQLITVVHECLSSSLSAILEDREYYSKEELKERVDNYFSTITECLSSDHTFVRDYNSAFPIEKELKLLCDICPDIDPVKRDFILESISSLYDLPQKSRSKSKDFTMGFQDQISSSTHNSEYKQELQNVTEACSSTSVTGVELQSLISQVKDILPHLGDGFIVKCLEHFNFVSEDVINALLENTLPESLVLQDTNMPYIPPEVEGANGISDRVNIYDNDEFDIMSRDKVDTSRVHRGKKREKYKNMFDMLDDKTEINQVRDAYTKLSLVECLENVNDYEDEYDDTYDDVDTLVGNEGETEVEERRAFVVPRILQQQKSLAENPANFESNGNVNNCDDEDDNNEDSGNKRDLFIENPADVRERLERRRQEQRRNYGSRPESSRSDVVGKPKGQGQEKDVVRSRESKNTNKAFRGNHNRRAMAARKQRQGMLPS